jgi:hypothetical protein
MRPALLQVDFSGRLPVLWRVTVFYCLISAFQGLSSMSGHDRFTAETLDPTGTTDHAATYKGFVKYSVALCIACFVILTSLCLFAFGPVGSLFYGFAGLIIGLIALVIDIRVGSGNWILSGVVAGLFALIAAMLVS